MLKTLDFISRFCFLSSSLYCIECTKICGRIIVVCGIILQCSGCRESAWRRWSTVLETWIISPALPLHKFHSLTQIYINSYFDSHELKTFLWVVFVVLIMHSPLNGAIWKSGKAYNRNSMPVVYIVGILLRWDLN